MTNKERQKILDDKMWKESKNYYDMHGYMPMCEYRNLYEECRNGEYDYKYIAENYICAKAYNKVTRSCK